MQYDLILKNVAKHISLTKEEMERFTSLIRYREMPRKTVVLQAGTPCRYLSYVHSGALRAYHVDADGRDATIMFALADWWVTDMYCFLNDRPAMMHIETLKDSCLFQISRQSLEELYRQVPKFERFFRILMQNAYTREQLRIIENLSLPAEARYENFLAKYPQIAKEISQKQIASYLGITPEFLSALKRKKRGTRIS